MVAYTTSRAWSGPKPPGVRVFERREAKSMGQDRAFTLDLRRIALLPVTEYWFPFLGRQDRGILGRATKALRQELEAEMIRILRPLLSGQIANRFNWLTSVAASNLVASGKSADRINSFSNTVTEKTCNNV